MKLYIIAITTLIAIGCGADKQGDEYGTTDDTGDGTGTDDTGGGDTDTDTDDADGDGWTTEEGDCDDTNAAFHPDADDYCGDFVDHNCDGDTECDCDHDGHDGEQCKGDDCDDTVATTYPGADDECHDGVDSDCVGNDDDDCDRDGYVDADYGGDDCNDADHTINPGELEVCGDEIDNDCDESTSDCDCDLDGHDAEECDGDDCDDTDATVYPDASEASADGLDNDCDGDIDEDAYCNSFYPLSNGSSASWEYSTSLEGTAYTETTNILSWDSATGEATIDRALNDGSSTTEIMLDIKCDLGEISVTGWDVWSGGASVSDSTFDQARVDMPEEADLVAGTSWRAEYSGGDSLGMLSYSVVAEFEVLGDEELTVTAGTFDTVVIQADYTIVDTGIGGLDREGTATYWYAQYVGLVYSIDETTAGAVYDHRELTGYTGFYP